MRDLNHNETLIIGIGNSGRSDDGLGWLLVEKVENSGSFQGDATFRYQLQVEDAELISHYNAVIFVDACYTPMNDGFAVKSCPAAASFSFSTHEIPPESILYLCQDLYHKSPRAILLLIEGKDWSLDIGLSKGAESNLQNTWNYLEREFL
ncbi:MAG: hydrogenase maturation protease [Saprospiraceae bacterium]|nr:hydrogenase maturation protease [Saprospiraceae bacterium]